MSLGAMDTCGGSGTVDDPFVECLDPAQSPLMPTASDLLPAFGVVAVIVVIIAVAIAVYRWKRISDKGYNPITVDWQLQDAAMDHMRPEHDADAPVRTARPLASTAQRLADLDALLAAGTITQEEHAAARARIIGDV